jgi:hypothetical protein
MTAAEVTRILDPAAPARKRQTSMATMARERAVPRVNNANAENDTRKIGRLPKSSESGA